MSAGDGPSISLVIPSRNGTSRLPTTLGSIAVQQVAARVEVIVVDDGSTDRTAETAARLPLPWGAPLVVRHDTACGRAAACNTGIQEARGELVVILDDDMTLLPGALEAHRRFHEANRAAAARGRVVLAPLEDSSCFRRFLYREEANQERQLVARYHDLPFPLCQTGHFSIQKSALLAAGGFDASITRYGFEDIELGYRLSRNGVRFVYLPEAESAHRAYITDLDRYLVRHLEAGIVARQLADRYAEGPLRDYLRVDGPRRLGMGRDPAGLVALRLSNHLLLRGPVRRALGSKAGFALLRGLLRAGEALHLERAVHFGYHVVRDIRYFQGYFAERGTRPVA